ncbi:nitrite reductase small subunit NirD [Thauera linaloolentis]|uniref:Nitrite reductase (NAD(P)H) large subunit, NirD n=1 Tax=Thauera linaloolentis (strain DSM 12138 / JCM 21573 / CCUG 41526 / CIP 105981 / IAM 15112 / NBRC 102519 / 47Lol) TaxID=1123367 RepID=N6XT46_THAL4|nr:nitrite reductase small subunit NirD [Thauera linaloolentis]ENO84896.1 nitrite reductase (NAD(P)H) large subunit, NirD [Thauera linaloolentis 47Lol = DSM 12138]MCM8564115.1 nitrite reductase small subunit NirD [Thauera linaloolentis]
MTVMTAPAPAAAVAAPIPTAVPAASPAAGPVWQPVCAVEDIWPDTGVCALLGGRQIAVFRLADGGLHAIDNHDPNSGANVLWRGIVGDLGGEPVVASPIYKHHYRLRDGGCIENPDTPLATHAVELRDGIVWVEA